MSKKEENKLKKAIQKLPLEQPSENFTDKVMSQLQVLPEDALLKDTVLSSLLKQHALEKPVANFSSQIMTQIENIAANPYRPLIGKKTWSLILLSLAGLVTYIIFSRPQEAAPNPYFSKFSGQLESAMSGLQTSFLEGAQVPSVFIISIASLSLLLLLDFLLKSKKATTY